MRSANSKALEVLTAIMQQFDDGAPQVYRDAYLFADDCTLHDHVAEAVQALDELLHPMSEAIVIPRSQRRRVGENWCGEWNGFIGKRKVIEFGSDRERAHQWLHGG